MLSDIRWALRSLRHRPGVSALAVGTLALGIASGTSVFTVVEGVLLRSLPFPHHERLVDIKLKYSGQTTASPGGDYSPFSLFEIWRRNMSDVEQMAAISMFETPVLLGVGPTQRVQAPSVTADFFTLLGATPELGRVFVAEDDLPGAAAMAVLSHRFWNSQLGGDPAAIGRTITLDTTLFTIVGVTRPDFQSSVGPHAHADLWLSIGNRLVHPGERHKIVVSVVGRLRPGVAPDELATRLDAMAKEEWSGYVGTRRPDVRSVVTPLREAYTGRYREPLVLMLAAVMFVLLIACANFSSLLVTRVVERGHTLAVRVALGARRSRLVREVIAEGVLLSLAAGAGGLLSSVWLVRFLVARAGSELPSAASFAINGRVLAVSVGMTAVAGVLASALPALLISGDRAVKLLKAGGTLSAPLHSTVRLYDASVAIQTGLTLVLLVGAGLLGRSFLRMVTLDLGFEPRDVVVATVELRGGRYGTFEARAAFVDAARNQLDILQGVSSVALATGVPIVGGPGGTVRILTRSGHTREVSTAIHGVTPEYFRTLKIPVLDGRTFTLSGSAEQLVVNEAAARSFFSGEDPLGGKVTFFAGTPLEWTGTVMGVVRSARTYFHDAPVPVVYYPLDRMPLRMVFIVARASGLSAGFQRPLREAIHAVDPGLAVEDLSTMSDRLSFFQARQRFYGLVLAAAAVLALVLAAAAVFAAANHAVAQRTRELGLRIALGARQGTVIRLVVAQGTRAVIVGAVVGIILALALTRALGSLLFEVRPGDPLVLAIMTVLLAGVSLLASYLPARRASAVDPMTALRAE